MINSIKDLYGYRLHPVFTEEDIGHIQDFYFDDREWMVRYAVVDTGEWISGRRVLIAPASFAGPPHWDTATLPVYLSREEIEHAPSMEAHQSVSRKLEKELAKHYHWPSYWEGTKKDDTVPKIAEKSIQRSQPLPEEHENRLRSAEEILRATVCAENEKTGDIIDLLYDDLTWSIRYLVVEIINELTAKSVLVAPPWVTGIEWGESAVHVGLTKSSIFHAPAYDPSVPITRLYENELYDYYGLPKYWRNG